MKMINKILKNEFFDISLILLILASSIFYLYIVHNPKLEQKLSETEDDLPWIMEGRVRAALGKFFDFQYFSSRRINIYFNPVQLMFWYYVWVNIGEEPFLWHFLTALIHLINVIVVFFLINKFIKNKFFSFLASFSFAVYLPNFFTMMYWVSSGITWGLTALFMLTAFFSAIEYFKTKNIFFYILSLSLFFTGTFIKELTVFLVPILFAYYVILQRKKELKFIKTDLIIIPYFILSLPIILITIARASKVPLTAVGASFDFSIGTFYRLLDFINFLITIVPASPDIKLEVAAFSLSLFFALIYFGLKNKNLLFLTIWLILLASIPVSLNFSDVYNSSRFIYLPSVAWFALLYYIAANIKNLKIKMLSTFFLINYTIILNLFFMLK